VNLFMGQLMPELHNAARQFTQMNVNERAIDVEVWVGDSYSSVTQFVGEDLNEEAGLREGERTASPW
jgi:hypothetical protein